MGQSAQCFGRITTLSPPADWAAYGIDVDSTMASDIQRLVTHCTKYHFSQIKTRVGDDGSPHCLAGVYRVSTSSI